MALAEAIAMDADCITRAAAKRRLVFVTLGQTIPLMSWSSRPVATALRAVGDSPVPWLDISAPSDPACFALVDPVKDRFGGPQRVHIQNARLYLSFSAETFQAAGANRFTMHFLCLMTSPQPLAGRLAATPKTVKPHFAKA